MSEEYAKDTEGGLWKRVGSADGGSGSSGGNGGCGPKGCAVVVLLVLAFGAWQLYSSGFSEKFLSRAGKADVPAESVHKETGTSGLTDVQRNWAAVSVPELYEKYAAFERSVDDVRRQIAQMEEDGANDAETLRTIRRSSAYATANSKLEIYERQMAELKDEIVRRRAAALAESVAAETEADRIFSATRSREASASDVSASAADDDGAGTETREPEPEPETPRSAPAPEATDDSDSVPAREATPAEKKALATDALVDAFDADDREAARARILDADLSDPRVLVAAINSKIASPQTLRYIIAHGGGANAPLPGTELPPLYYAILAKRADFVRALLASGANPNASVKLNGRVLTLRQLAAERDEACRREIFFAEK